MDAETAPARSPITTFSSCGQPTTSANLMLAFSFFLLPRVLWASGKKREIRGTFFHSSLPSPLGGSQRQVRYHKADEVARDKHSSIYEDAHPWRHRLYFSPSTTTTSNSSTATCLWATSIVAPNRAGGPSGAYLWWHRHGCQGRLASTTTTTTTFYSTTTDTFIFSATTTIRFCRETRTALVAGWSDCRASRHSSGPSTVLPGSWQGALHFYRGAACHHPLAPIVPIATTIIGCLVFYFLLLNISKFSFLLSFFCFSCLLHILCFPILVCFLFTNLVTYFSSIRI